MRGQPIVLKLQTRRQSSISIQPKSKSFTAKVAEDAKEDWKFTNEISGVLVPSAQHF